MNVWLVDFDGKIENLALMRLSTHHKQKGDTVKLKHGMAYPELFDKPDRLYISCIFKWNNKTAQELQQAWGSVAMLGGSGVSLEKELPPDVQHCKPDYTLYNKTRAIGFISRGCVRRCPWCVVPMKEGKLHRVSTAQEIVGERTEAIFLDNNPLALPDICADLEWLAKNDIAIDFNQGLDARLIDVTCARMLYRCKWQASGSTVRIALDHTSMIPSVDKALTNLVQAGFSQKRIFVYCLIGFHGLQDDIWRLLFLHHKNVNVFPMGYRDIETGNEPAQGWNKKQYKKYRRLICRMPHAKGVWDDFKQDVKNNRLVA